MTTEAPATTTTRRPGTGGNGSGNTTAPEMKCCGEYPARYVEENSWRFKTWSDSRFPTKAADSPAVDLPRTTQTGTAAAQAASCHLVSASANWWFLYNFICNKQRNIKTSLQGNEHNFEERKVSCCRKQCFESDEKWDASELRASERELSLARARGYF